MIEAVPAVSLLNPRSRMEYAIVEFAGMFVPAISKATNNMLLWNKLQWKGMLDERKWKNVRKKHASFDSR